jgi:hypothetical protein
MDRAELQGYLDQGLSFEAIGRLLDRDPSTVAYWARKHGLQSPHAKRHAAKGPIPRDRLEKLVDEGLSIRAIAQALERTPTTVRHWLRVHGLRTARRRHPANDGSDGASRIIRRCTRHGQTEFVRTGTRGRYRCRRCRAEYRAERRRRVKGILVAEAGGRCVRCGYFGPPAAMHFHHRDPATKAFSLSAQGVGRYDGLPGALQFHHRDPATKAFGLSQAGVARSLERSREEARKCALLCANCHAEVEWAGANLTTVHPASPMHHNPG